MAKQDEVDAYCTKCKMDLNHRVVARAAVSKADLDRVAPERRAATRASAPIERVECLTCHTQHNYYRPKSAPAERAAKVKRVAGPKTTAPSTSTKTAVGQRLFWEKAIAGRTANEFTTYAPASQFVLGQLVRHAKFGEGVVMEVNDAHKVTILFADGVKLLAQALGR